MMEKTTYYIKQKKEGMRCKDESYLLLMNFN